MAECRIDIEGWQDRELYQVKEPRRRRRGSLT